MKENEIRVWDPFMRVFHWILAISFAQTYFTEYDFLNLHVWFGYIISVLLIFRIVWGVSGSRYARFSDFIKPLAIVFSYLRDIFRGSSKRFIGHNPAGRALSGD